jgi:hypothetical protein
MENNLITTYILGKPEKKLKLYTLSQLFFPVSQWLATKRIYRGYYTAARRYDFYLRVVKTIFYERAQRVSKILFLTRDNIVFNTVYISLCIFQYLTLYYIIKSFTVQYFYLYLESRMLLQYRQWTRSLWILQSFFRTSRREHKMLEFEIDVLRS